MKSSLKTKVKSSFLNPLSFNKGGVSHFGKKNIQAKFNPSQFRTQHKGGS